MRLDDDSWFVVRNTPGVTGFVGAGNKPSPLPRKDVEMFLSEADEATETVRITSLTDESVSGSIPQPAVSSVAAMTTPAIS